MQNSDQGYIILETNYRLYAYTTSQLKISLLSLFVHIKYRLANLAVGVVTRESIREALINGITSDQIINFLTQNAHPQSRKKFPWIPETVQEQIKLWEAERNRVQYHTGVLWEKFPNEDTYKKYVECASDLGVLIYTNPQQRYMFITEEGVDQIKNIFKDTSSKKK